MEDADIDPLAQLSAALGLSFEQQDWGITNADGHRVGEFIRFYLAEHGMAAPLQHAMGELILASMNEAIEQGAASPALTAAFVDFWNGQQNDFREVVRYWRSLNPDDFPVVRLLA